MKLNCPPLCTELPYQKESSSYFKIIKDKPWAVFLDSSSSDHPDSRYDIQTADPFITLSTVGQNTLVTYRDDHSELSSSDPFLLLHELLKEYQPEHPTDFPFCGGALGYLSYDLGRRVESIPNTAVDAEHIPEMVMGIYDWAIITDHQQQSCWLVSYGLHSETHLHWDDLVSLLRSPSATFSSSFKVTSTLSSNMDRSQYQTAFDKIKHYIREGDCYQVNLAKRFEITASGDPYFSTPYATVLSSSPERLLKVEGNHVETKPIKGTRPRDLTNLENDELLATELQSSIKDRAENLMIVDLLRNDLGKVCQPGSIKVPNPFALESFATVHHLVSTITGTLSENQSALSLLRACFPGGSITGAPKLRAMEVIEELEPHRRGVYCGSMAYIGFDGKMDSNITIRTLIYSDDRLRFWAGGGIVADSDVDEEYQELHDKAAAMLRLIEQLR